MNCRIKTPRSTKMDYSTMAPSHHSESWLSDTYEQDFCYGAKTLPFQNPGFSTPSDHSAFTEHTYEWMENLELQNTFDDYPILETFNDVLLPKNLVFGPEHLFEDLKEENCTRETPLGLPAARELPSTSRDSQKIRIKLKRIKCPKTLKQNSHQLRKRDSGEVEFVIVSQKYSSAGEDAISHHELSNEMDYEFDEPLILNKNSLQVFGDCNTLSLPEDQTASDLTLLDAIDLGQADDILNKFLTPKQDLSVAGEFEHDPKVYEFMSQEDESLFSTSTLFLPSPTSNYQPLSPASSWSSQGLSPRTHEMVDICQLSPITSLENESSPQGLSPRTLETVDICQLSPISSFENESSSQGLSPRTLETVDICQLSPISSLENESDIEPSQTEWKPKASDRKSVKAHTRLSQESRHLRKKEQNKQAALRYRQKKKTQDNTLQTLLSKEESRSETLEKEYSTIKQEISFMKKLLREAFIAKNLVPKDAFSRKIK